MITNNRATDNTPGDHPSSHPPLCTSGWQGGEQEKLGKACGSLKGTNGSWGYALRAANPVHPCSNVGVVGIPHGDGDTVGHLFSFQIEKDSRSSTVSSCISLSLEREKLLHKLQPLQRPPLVRFVS